MNDPFDFNMDTEPEAVLVSRSRNGITTIAINQQHRKNAVNPATARKLRDAFLDFEEDSTQRVCVFHSVNGTFCAGADLHDIAVRNPKAEEGSSGSMERVNGRNIAPMGPSRMQIKKPVIAAIAGYAVAGGLELSLLADMRVVEEDAVFGVFCRRWGVPLIDGGTVRLQAIVGLGRAMDMILTGRPVSAQEALSMGLANRVVKKGTSLAAAQRLAEQLLTFPQGCMNVDRASCYYSAYNATSFQDALSNEFDNGVKVVSKESIQGAAKFSKGEGRHGKFDDNTRPSSKL